MNLLLDTHSFIWWTTSPQQLSATAHAACQDRRNTLLLSVASMWEMQIKVQIGKLQLPKPLAQLVENQQRVNNMRVLSIEPTHIYALDALPLHHKDPFDRMLLAQANTDQLTLVSADSAFTLYGVSLLW